MMPVTENNVAYDFNIDNKIKINKFSHVTSGKLATYIENFVNTLNFFETVKLSRLFCEKKFTNFLFLSYEYLLKSLT